MRIAVTGSTGFIGRHIANRLANEGHTVLAYGRREIPPDLHPSIEYRRWDIRERLEGPEVDAVVHSAAHVSDWGSYDDFYATNVVGTENVLAAFNTSKRFIHISTASVYSKCFTDRGLRESDTIIGTRQSNYGATKALAENTVLQSGRTAVVLRPRAVYGEGDANLLPRLLRASKFGHLLAAGDGNNKVSITHVYNLVHAVERSLQTKPGATVYNVADDKTAQIAQLLSAIGVAAGLSRDVWFIPRVVAMPTALISELLWSTFRLPGQPPLTRYAVGQLSEPWTLDIVKAQQQLEYKPKFTYRDALSGITAEYNHDAVD